MPVTQSHLCGRGGVSVGLLRGAASVHHVRSAQPVQVAAVLGVVDVVLKEHLTSTHTSVTSHFRDQLG